MTISQRHNIEQDSMMPFARLTFWGFICFLATFFVFGFYSFFLLHRFFVVVVSHRCLVWSGGEPLKERIDTGHLQRRIEMYNGNFLRNVNEIIKVSFFFLSLLCLNCAYPIHTDTHEIPFGVMQ